MNKDFFSAKSVLIMGLGRFGGGVDAAKFASKAGASVTITDLAGRHDLADSIKQLKSFKDIKYHLGSHKHSYFQEADIIIVNPAIRPDNEFLKTAREQNKFITSQINIFFELSEALTIGVTGANGKSTTAALTAHLLRAGLGRKGFKFPDVFLAGNIGNMPLLDKIDQIKADSLVVLELSSFQIEQLAQAQKAPVVAVITNLTPNHLDRHGSFAAYCQAKENIFKLQKLDPDRPAVSVFNADDTIAAEWFQKYNGQEGRICLKYKADDLSEDFRSKFLLPGRANLSNLAAAITVARHFGLQDDQIKNALPKFKTLPHRLELVATVNSVFWYNDSVSTTPQSTIEALESFDEPSIIIAGGYDKNLAFDKLGKKIAQKAKAAILLGQTADKIERAIRTAGKTVIPIEIVYSLDDAVDLARQLARPGDIVLLSPACASYDMFDNFIQRGRKFTELVKNLKSKYKT